MHSQRLLNVIVLCRPAISQNCCYTTTPHPTAGYGVVGSGAGATDSGHRGWLTLGGCSGIVEMSGVGASDSRHHAGSARRLGGAIVPQRGISSLIRRPRVDASSSRSMAPSRLASPASGCAVQIETNRGKS